MRNYQKRINENKLTFKDCFIFIVTIFMLFCGLWLPSILDVVINQ